MSLRTELDRDLRSALRAGDELSKGTIRLMLAALKNREIENRGPLSPEQERALLAREAKQRRESAVEYERLGRPDVAEKDLAQLGVIERYLPQQLPPDEVRRVVLEVIGETGAASVADMRRVIPAVMERVRGQADGRVVAEMVRQALASGGS